MPKVSAKLVKQVIDAYNTNINHGHVPWQLISEDPELWGEIMTYKMCMDYAQCGSDATADNPDPPDCSIVQCADAYHQSVHHYLSISVEPYSCHEGTGCLYTDYDTGTGTLKVSLSGQKHTNTPKLEYTVNLASGTSSAYLVATGTLSVGRTDGDIDPVTGVGAAYVANSECVDGAACGSSHCGTYSFAAESNSYIMH